MAAKPYKYGLTLSGGGMRAFAHLGALKALMGAGFTPEIISGTSMGAIIGALIADGYAPEEIANMAIEANQDSKKFIQSKFSTESILKMEGIQDFLQKNLRAKNIEDLKIPLVVAATNLEEGKIEFFRKGDLITSIIASSSIPIIFPPVAIGEFRYVDGGVLANLPVRAIREECEKIVAIHANPVASENKKIEGFAQIAERCFYLAVRSNIVGDQHMSDLFIEPEGLEQFGILGLKKMKIIFDLGYNYTFALLKTKRFNFSENIEG